MRRVLSLGALVTLMAIAASPVSAQTPQTPWFLNVSAGPTFDSGGTSGGSLTSLGATISKHLSVAAEFGTSQDSIRLSNLPTVGARPTKDRAMAYQMNGNVRVQLPEVARWTSNLTAGLGAYRGAWAVPTGTPDRVPSIQRASYPALNVGGGLAYRFNDRIALGADWRHYYVMSEEPATNTLTGRRPNERINRVTFGASFSFN